MLVAFAAPAFGQSNPAGPTTTTTGSPPAAAPTAPTPAASAPAPAASAPTVTAPGSPPAEIQQNRVNYANYIINPGDELQIYVWGEERLQRDMRVLPDGTIAFPLVGQLKVQGLLPQDVERLLSDRLKGQYRGEVPNVTVSIKNPAGMLFSVMGKVKSPGSFTPGRMINVLDAITLAGGPAEFAKLDKITIMRRRPDGGVTTLRVRLGKVFRGDVSSADVVPLEVGDIVIVP